MWLAWQACCCMSCSPAIQGLGACWPLHGCLTSSLVTLLDCMVHQQEYTMLAAPSMPQHSTPQLLLQQLLRQQVC